MLVMEFVLASTVYVSVLVFLYRLRVECCCIVSVLVLVFMYPLRVVCSCIVCVLKLVRHVCVLAVVLV